MSRLPIFYGVPNLSLEAVMIFPNDLAKAKAWVGWKLAGGPLGAFRARGHFLPATEIVDIAADAALFSDYSDEAKQNEFKGSAVGTVVTALWVLIHQETKRASWERAIQRAEKLGTEHGCRTGKSSLRAYLSEFSPVLHLLGAWQLRKCRWIVDNSVGYTAPIDASFFVAESRLLLGMLREWSERRAFSEKILSSTKFIGGMNWMPPEHVRGWPETGRIYPVLVPEWYDPAERAREKKTKKENLSIRSWIAVSHRRRMVASSHIQVVKLEATRHGKDTRRQPAGRARHLVAGGRRSWHTCPV
jgi:hypothetical protein